MFHGGEVYKRQGDVYEVNFGEEGMFYPCAKDLEPYDGTYPRTGHDEEFSEGRKPRLNGVVCINWEWSSEYGDIESGEDQIPVPDTSEETIKRAVRKFCNKKDEWDEVGGHSDNVYLEVFLTDYGMGEPEFLFDGSFAYGDIKWFDNDGKENHKYRGETYMESISKKNYTKGAYPTYVVKERLVDLIEGCPKENPMWADLVEILEKYYGEAELEHVMESTRKLNTTRKHFQESQYYTRKYGKLAFVSESGKEFKTDKGYFVEFKGE